MASVVSTSPIKEPTAMLAVDDQGVLAAKPDPGHDRVMRLQQRRRVHPGPELLVRVPFRQQPHQASQTGAQQLVVVAAPGVLGDAAGRRQRFIGRRRRAAPGRCPRRVCRVRRLPTRRWPSLAQPPDRAPSVPAPPAVPRRTTGHTPAAGWHAARRHRVRRRGARPRSVRCGRRCGRRLDPAALGASGSSRVPPSARCGSRAATAPGSALNGACRSQVRHRAVPPLCQPAPLARLRPEVVSCGQHRRTASTRSPGSAARWARTRPRAPALRRRRQAVEWNPARSGDAVTKGAYSGRIGENTSTNSLSSSISAPWNSFGPKK